MIDHNSERSSLDAKLVEILQAQLRCDVLLVPPESVVDGSAEEAALREPGRAAVVCHGDESSIAIKLPAGNAAAWRSESRFAKNSASHGETVIALQSALNERHQLQAEVDALATQVVNDFEELSLIRSLASSMELPRSGAEINELAMNSLRPLAAGVGAVSIAAVFLDDDGKELESPLWSGEAIVPDDSLFQLIEEHRGEATMQPIVRNRIDDSDQPITEGLLNEFVMVQCRSEGRLHGWLIACNRVEDADQDVPWAQLGFTTVQASLLETATNQLAAQLHNMRLLRQKEELFTDVVRALVNAVEARDPYTCGHSERVARFARCLGSAIGESLVGCERIYLTGLLHDVGKIAIPDGVLQKPGHLNTQEREIIETHTEAGWRILHELEALRDVLPGVLYHHERFDGKGYPDGLVGENIPLDGRILAVCDSFDAMTSDRPYRTGMPTESALQILQDGSGKYWDPKLVDAFVSNISAIEEIRSKHRPRQHAARPAPVGGQPSIDAHASNPA